MLKIELDEMCSTDCVKFEESTLAFMVGSYYAGQDNTAYIDVCMSDTDGYTFIIDMNKHEIKIIKD